MKNIDWQKLDKADADKIKKIEGLISTDSSDFFHAFVDTKEEGIFYIFDVGGPISHISNQGEYHYVVIKSMVEKCTAEEIYLLIRENMKKVAEDVEEYNTHIKEMKERINGILDNEPI